MNRNAGIYLIAVAVAAAAATYGVHEGNLHRQQGATNDNLRHEVQLTARLKAQNAALRAELDSPDALADLDQERSQLDPLRTRLDRTMFQLRQLQRADGEKPKALWPPETTVLAASDWKNVGSASPSDAMQSFLWAARGGNIEEVKKLIAMEPAAKAYADSAFAKLPAATRQQYGSPEKLIATYVTAKIPDYAAMGQVGSEFPSDSSTILHYRLEDNGGDQRDFRFLFTKSNAGTWQLAVPSVAVTEYVGDLEGRAALK